MDDRVVDFNELKNKVRDKDIDKFESYIYDLYYSVATGGMSMADFTKKVTEYMNDNNISQEKFFNIQKEMLKRYGFDPLNYYQEVLDKHKNDFMIKDNHLICTKREILNTILVDFLL